ncbi:MAG: iron-sulfur cluster repair di-iron protein [Acidobacteriota bacterium]
MIHRENTLRDIAVEHPLSTRVLERHGIDFCCGGGVTLQQACERRGLDTETVLNEIRREIAETGVSATRWDEEPLTALVEHILNDYHAPLREELQRLESMARKVYEVHQDEEPGMLGELLKVVLGLKVELEQHMLKEEQILFPMIQQGQGWQAEGPVSVMRQEHEEAGAALEKLRKLTKDYEVPEKACTSWRALWAGLEALEKALHQHIHLENNILFPRALKEV